MSLLSLLTPKQINGIMSASVDINRAVWALNVDLKHHGRQLRSFVNEKQQKEYIKKCVAYAIAALETVKIK